MEYNYGDVIEYIDGTKDENFDNARYWAKEHNTSFAELLDRRNLPKRYFQIGEEYIPTHDDISKQREEYRKEHIDSKTSERTRRTANSTWTEEDEQSYLALDAEVTAWIEENLPYPEGEENAAEEG